MSKKAIIINLSLVTAIEIKQLYLDSNTVKITYFFKGGGTSDGTKTLNEDETIESLVEKINGTMNDKGMPTTVTFCS